MTLADESQKNEEAAEKFIATSSEEKPPKHRPITRRLKLNYASMCFFAFLTGCDFAVIIPTLWERLNKDFGGDGLFMGVVISAYSFSGVVSGFFMGKLSDEINSTKIFYISSTLFAIAGHIIYFLGISKYLILVSRCVCGFSLGASTVALAYIARTTSTEKRTGIISLVMASRQIGLMFGPGFNFFLRIFDFNLFGIEWLRCDRKSSPGLFMFIWWLLCLLVFIFAYSDAGDDDAAKSRAEIEEKHEQEQIEKGERNFSSFKREFMRVEIIILLLTTFFTYFNQTSLETIVTPFTKFYFNWGELQNSILFCAGGTIIIISYVFVRLISKKFNDRVVLVLGTFFILIGLTVGCATLPFAKKFEANLLNNTLNNNNKTVEERADESMKFFPAFVVFVFFDVIGLPAVAISSVSLFTKHVHHDKQGLGQGIQRGILGLSTIVGPLYAGLFIENAIVLIASTLTILLVIFVLIIVFYKRLRPMDERKKRLSKQISENNLPESQQIKEA